MTTLRLEAFSPTEGIGLVRSENELRLIRPPYALNSSPVVEESSIQEAVLQAGFTVSQSEFENWNELIQFLNEEVVRSRKELGYVVPDEISPDDVFDIATPEALKELLDRIELEILPKFQFDVAETILVSFLAHDAAHLHPELGRRAARLLKILKYARQSRADTAKATSKDIRFSSLLSHGAYDRCVAIAEIIKARGSIFSLTS